MNNRTTNCGSTTLTVQNIEAGNPASGHRPEFIRLPKGGLCPWTGLSRAKMYELILPCESNGFKAPVKSVCLRKPGAVKGARLIHLQSLLGYLEERMEGGMDEKS